MDALNKDSTDTSRYFLMQLPCQIFYSLYGLLILFVVSIYFDVEFYISLIFSYCVCTLLVLCILLFDKPDKYSGVFGNTQTHVKSKISMNRIWTVHWKKCQNKQT